MTITSFHRQFLMFHYVRSFSNGLEELSSKKLKYNYKIKYNFGQKNRILQFVDLYFTSSNLN